MNVIISPNKTKTPQKGMVVATVHQKQEGNPYTHHIGGLSIRE